MKTRFIKLPYFSDAEMGRGTVVPKPSGSMSARRQHLLVECTGARGFGGGGGAGRSGGSRYRRALEGRRIPSAGGLWASLSVLRAALDGLLEGILATAMLYPSVEVGIAR